MQPSNLRSSSKGFAVTPHNSTNFTTQARKLYVGGAGAIVIVHPDGTTCTFSAVTAGTWIDLTCIRVNATGTTATGIVALA